MTIENLTKYCKDGGWRFVIKPDNILTFDNPDFMFISGQNDLVGCVMATSKEQQNINYLHRRLYQIRASYPESLQLVLLNGDCVRGRDELRCFCNAVSITEDEPRYLYSYIEDGKNNKQLFKIPRKFRNQISERSYILLNNQEHCNVSLERQQEVRVTPWPKYEVMTSNKIYQTQEHCIVRLQSSKDPHILTILNYMDIGLFRNDYCFNNDYLTMPRMGILEGYFSAARKYELALKYAQLGVKCIFTDGYEEN